MHMCGGYHAVNAPLWQPGEHADSQSLDRQTNKPTDYYNPWPWPGLGLKTFRFKKVSLGTRLATAGQPALRLALIHSLAQPLAD